MIVGFHPFANQELTDAAQFYEARAPGLGTRFLDAVERSLALLSIHPELGRPGPGPFRAFPIRRFPYALSIALILTGWKFSRLRTIDVTRSTGADGSARGRHNMQMQLASAPMMRLRRKRARS